MKYFSLLPLLLITGAQAQTFVLPFEAICDNTRVIVGKLQSVNETPIIIGQASDQAGTTMVLWMNLSTKAWTITATKAETTCVIGTGEQLKFTKSSPTV
jgi:hypothetical protein